MQRTIFTASDPAFSWVDVVDPTPEELRVVAEQYRLHPTSVQDCLDPEHLPKFEPIADTTFVIVRAWDDEAPSDAVTVQEATRKVAIFCGPGFLLTIHRKVQPYLVRLFEKYAEAERTAGKYSQVRTAHHPRVVIDLLMGAVLSYEKPLEQAEAGADRFEGTLFGSQLVGELLREIYVIKRRVLLIKRLLWHTQSVLQRLAPAGEPSAPLFQDLRETAESLHSYSDELLDEVVSLLNVHIALASHRTNEIVRVLTLFSVFFLPLTFIVGIYGMNFAFMPELRQPWGYPAALGLMVLVTAGIYLWFRRKGWLP